MRYEVLMDECIGRIDIRRDKGNWYRISVSRLRQLVNKDMHRILFAPLIMDVSNHEYIFQKAVEESQCIDFEEVHGSEQFDHGDIQILSEEEFKKLL